MPKLDLSKIEQIFEENISELEARRDNVDASTQKDVEEITSIINHLSIVLWSIQNAANREGN